MVNNTIKLIQNNIKKYRNQKGITQAQLSETVGISCDYLSEIERGKTAPSLKRLIMIAIGLGIEPKDLFKE